MKYEFNSEESEIHKDSRGCRFLALGIKNKKSNVYKGRLSMRLTLILKGSKGMEQIWKIRLCNEKRGEKYTH